MVRQFQLQKRRLLKVGISLFVLLTCIRVWVGPVAILEPAQAQIPDSGLQRKLILDETRRTNQLLAEIKQLLKTHTFNVRVQGADNPSSKRTGSRGG